MDDPGDSPSCSSTSQAKAGADYPPQPQRAVNSHRRTRTRPDEAFVDSEPHLSTMAVGCQKSAVPVSCTDAQGQPQGPSSGTPQAPPRRAPVWSVAAGGSRQPCTSVTYLPVPRPAASRSWIAATDSSGSMIVSSGRI